ncbi:hypothetical protein DL96DRAFT_1414300, partial [Flagelloscypha sp. PMI_526]
PAIFRTYRTRNHHDIIDCELWQAFRATTADLGMDKFDEVIIGHERFSGTSIKNGNPTQLLTHEIRQLYPNREVDLVLSLGCGHPGTISLPKGASKDVEKTLISLSLDCEETHENMCKYWTEHSPRTYSTGPYRRLSVDQGMQNMEGESYSSEVCGAVISHSKQYMSRADVDFEIDHIVEILK